MITNPIAMLDLAGRMVLEFVRSIPKTVYAGFLVVALVLMGQPAQAASIALPTATTDDPTSFIGCPTLAWAAPLQGTSQNVTGMVFGFLVIAVLLLMLINGIKLAFANNRSDKASGAIEGVKNAGLGALFVFIGIPIIAAITWGLVTTFSPACLG